MTHPNLTVYVPNQQYIHNRITYKYHYMFRCTDPKKANSVIFTYLFHGKLRFFLRNTNSEIQKLEDHFSYHSPFCCFQHKLTNATDTAHSSLRLPVCQIWRYQPQATVQANRDCSAICWRNCKIHKNVTFRAGWNSSLGQVHKMASRAWCLGCDSWRWFSIQIYKWI
jgi:hypothetical protein